MKWFDVGLKLAFPLAFPLLGAAWLPMKLVGFFREDHSGDGELPFVIGFFGTVLGCIGAGVFGTTPFLLGVPWFIAYPCAYYLSLALPLFLAGRLW